jgi:hypothetical protein
MYDGQTDDDGRQVMAKAHMAFFFQPIYTDYAN